MKKVCFSILTLLLVVSIIGCSKKTAPVPEDNFFDNLISGEIEIGSSPNSESENQYFDLTPTPNWAIQEDLSNGEWKASEVTGSDICIDTFVNGFPELSLGEYVENMQDVKYYVQDSRYILTFTYHMPEHDSYWELHAEHTGKPVNISGISESDMLFINEGESEYGIHIADYVIISSGENYSDVSLYYAEKTGNSYSLYCKNPYFVGEEYRQVYPNIIFGFDAEDPAFSEEIYNTTEKGFFHPLKTPIMLDFKIVTGEVTKTYKYRFGSMMEEWINSELNTDGWHRSNSSNVIFLSSDNQYSIEADTIQPTMIAKSWPNTSDTGIQHYAEKSLYCFNSQTELYLTGIQVLSKQFPEENFDDIILNNIRSMLGTQDDITINMDVYYDGVVENMRVYFAPHSDNTTELPADVTEVPVSETTVTRRHPYGEEEVLAATVNYKPAEDPNFNPDSGVDMFIAYKDEIIYKVAFPQFYNR